MQNHTPAAVQEGVDRRNKVFDHIIFVVCCVNDGFWLDLLVTMMTLPWRRDEKLHCTHQNCRNA